ncbi:MAG: hypothetical protein M3162_01245 [Thermoproteota archaeon]|nr:hypothetical protein [Thermoproteota archaeon]
MTVIYEKNENPVQEKYSLFHYSGYAIGHNVIVKNLFVVVSRGSLFESSLERGHENQLIMYPIDQVIVLVHKWLVMLKQMMMMSTGKYTMI